MVKVDDNATRDENIPRFLVVLWFLIIFTPTEPMQGVFCYDNEFERSLSGKSL